MTASTLPASPTPRKSNDVLASTSRHVVREKALDALKSGLPIAAWTYVQLSFGYPAQDWTRTPPRSTFQTEHNP